MTTDRVGRQTPDMTGLTRVMGNGKPRIYKMSEDIWVVEYRHMKGVDVKVCPSWVACVNELNSIFRSYKSRYGMFGTYYG